MPSTRRRKREPRRTAAIEEENWRRKYVRAESSEKDGESEKSGEGSTIIHEEKRENKMKEGGGRDGRRIYNEIAKEAKI